MFTQTFSNIDPGLITLPAVLGGLQPEILYSSGLSVTPSSLGPFATDKACAAQCGLSATAPSECLMRSRCTAVGWHANLILLMPRRCCSCHRLPGLRPGLTVLQAQLASRASCLAPQVWDCQRLQPAACDCHRDHGTGLRMLFSISAAGPEQSGSPSLMHPMHQVRTVQSISRPFRSRICVSLLVATAQAGLLFPGQDSWSAWGWAVMPCFVLIDVCPESSQLLII